LTRQNLRRAAEPLVLKFNRPARCARQKILTVLPCPASAASSSISDFLQGKCQSETAFHFPRIVSTYRLSVGLPFSVHVFFLPLFTDFSSRNACKSSAPPIPQCREALCPHESARTPFSPAPPRPPPPSPPRNQPRPDFVYSPAVPPQSWTLLVWPNQHPATWTFCFFPVPNQRKFYKPLWKTRFSRDSTQNTFCRRSRRRSRAFSSSSPPHGKSPPES